MREQVFALSLRGVSRVYGAGTSDEAVVLRSIDFHVPRGQFVAIVGPSGSGKSTLLNILGCLDAPSSGEYHIAGIALSALRGREMAKLRNDNIGYVFQSFNLIPQLSAVENVALPLVYAGVGVRERRSRALNALERVGLISRARHRPSALSGGQQQRVAIARAVVNAPIFLLADEPTGNLDSHSAEIILDLFKTIHKEGATVVMITHDDDVAAAAQRVVRLRDGGIVSDTMSEMRA